MSGKRGKGEGSVHRLRSGSSAISPAFSSTGTLSSWMVLPSYSETVFTFKAPRYSCAVSFWSFSRNGDFSFSAMFRQ